MKLNEIDRMDVRLNPEMVLDTETDMPVLPEGMWWRVSNYDTEFIKIAIVRHIQVAKFFGVKTIEEDVDFDLFHKEIIGSSVLAGDEIVRSQATRLYYAKVRRDDKTDRRIREIVEKRQEELKSKRKAEEKLSKYFGDYPPKSAGK